MNSNLDAITSAFELIRRAGIRINGGDLDALTLVLPDGRSVQVEVHRSGGVPSSHRIQEDRANRPTIRHLYIVDQASDSAVSAAKHGQMDLISTEPGSVVIKGVDLLTGLHSPQDRKNRGTRPRASWHRWALIRMLILAERPMTQMELAEISGSSQQAVAKSLKSLEQQIERTQRGWRARDTRALMDEWCRLYPGPGGAPTSWYSLKSAAHQADVAVELASGLGAEPLISGDAAADIYAPWRLPTSSIMYVREFVDLTDVGFSSAGRAEATMTVQVPDDPTLWAVRNPHRSVQSISLVDPLIVLWDLNHTQGSDVAEAATKLREKIEAKQITL